MTQKLLDVWLIETNTVYKDVPYTVIIDWIQQGRLLEEDQVRQAGTDKWFRISTSKALVAYFPRAEPFRADDQAEALEPVALDFTWKRPKGDFDEDVDMIPLIDISLVLLVFFMMTASIIVSATSINVPAVQEGYFFTGAPGTMWIGIDRVLGADGKERPPTYSFGEGDSAAPPENTGLTEAEVAQKLGKILEARNLPTSLRIAADRRVPAETVMSMTAALEPYRKYLREIRAEVREKQP